ncbi:MAG: SapC family protein [Alphaproteobacteria bacterium]|nr:SapC family protein [Alphaproteobacteria bacterium]
MANEAENGKGGGEKGPSGGAGVMPVLYHRIEALHPSTHGRLAIRKVIGPYSFAAEAHAIPVTAQEFPFLLKTFPIVFSGGEQPLPLAVLGLRQGENLFVDEDGDWAEGIYIPAYIRRYPFLFATDEKAERYTLAIDTSSALVGTDGENKLFEGEEPTDYLKQILEFCQHFQRQHMQTRMLGELLRTHELLKPREVQITLPSGEVQTLGRHVGVDQQALDALSDTAFLELRSKGALPWIYFHLASSVNWERLMARHQTRLAASVLPEG